MKFSLVLGTVGRTEELEFFLKSLESQTHTDFELIVVDQNKDNKIDKLIEKYEKEFLIKHLKIEDIGLSLARNTGLKQVTGDVIAFPDDDCEYPEQLLENVDAFFQGTDKYRILAGIARDRKTGKIHGGMLKENCEITGYNVFQTVISFSVFVRTLTEERQFFNEDMGLGRYFGSAEETDYIFRLLSEGHRGVYCPQKIIVYHPPEVDRIGSKEIQRAYSYGLGMGAFFNQHLIKEKNLCLIPYFIRFFFITPAGGFLMSMTKKENRSYFKNLLFGRWNGLIRYKVPR